MKKRIIAAWAIITIILVVWVVRLNGRVYDLEKISSYNHAALVVYLQPDDNVVKCYQEMLWREQATK